MADITYSQAFLNAIDDITERFREHLVAASEAHADEARGTDQVEACDIPRRVDFDCRKPIPSTDRNS